MGKWTYLCVNNDESVNLYKKLLVLKPNQLTFKKR